MSDDWGNRGGEWAPSEADLLAAGYRYSGGDGGGWPPPPAPPEPTPWNTPGQHLVLDSKSTKWTGNGWRYFADMTYNGNSVVFVPQEFVTRGGVFNREQIWSPLFSDPELQKYLKPAVVDQSVIDNPTFKPNVSTFWKEHFYTSPREGFIVPSSMLSAAAKRNNNTWLMTQQMPKRRGGIAGILQDFGGFLNEMPGLGKLAIAAFVPGGATFMASFHATQAAMRGDWGGAVLAALPMFVPAPNGAPPAIPGFDQATTALGEAIGVSASTAGVILQTTLKLAANGGDIKALLKDEVASYLGQEAGKFVGNFAKQFDLEGMQKVVQNVTQAGTKALLLNQDVGKASATAFAETAVPMALNKVPGYTDWAKANPKLADALKTAAVGTAATGDLEGAVRTATEQAAVKAFAPMAEAALAKEGVKITDAQRRLLESSLIAAVQGKPIDTAIQQYALSEARTAIKNQVAQAEGWKDDAQKQQAISAYGSKINPNEYVAKQQGWEDYAAKQAAIKSYGDTVTPLGFKEREQVKSIDPEFDATAYAKLNEVTGDPFLHFLEQGQKSNLPTNYEDGAEKALAAIGYKADADEIKQVADLFKTSANPDVALNKFYDERWVTPEEAIATARQAGFDLTPGQVAAFTGQARSGQSTVFEDIGMAAKIGKAAQQKRTAFIDNTLSDIAQAYEDQGYTKAQIAAAMPEIRSRINNSAEQTINQAADYAEQIKKAYGSQSSEYSEAQRKLLETKSAIGGHDVVQEGNVFKSVSGETLRADNPLQSESWLKSQPKKEPRIAIYFDDEWKAAQEIGSLAHIGKTADEKLLPGPLAALFGGEAGGGAKTGAGFSLIGRTGAGEPVYGQEGFDFSLITLADGTTKAVNPKTQEVYLVPPQQVAALLPKAPALPQEQVPKTVQDIIKAADEKRISPQEAQKALEEAIGKAGYKATPEEIQQQIAALQGEKTPEQLQKEIGEYIDPRMVTAEEVKQMYRDLGLMEPTEADISRFTGQRAQSDLPEILKPYLPTASANVIAQQAQQDAARRAAIDSQIGGLDSRITELQRQGMSQMDATNKALAELASGQAGLGQQITGLQAGFGKALEGLATGFGKTTAGLQQQLGQAQQQAELGNLITILGLGQKQQQPAAPIPLVGQIKPYDFSSDLLQGIYKPPQAGLFGTNDQLLRMTRG